MLLHVERVAKLNIILREFPCNYFAFVYLESHYILGMHILIISLINMNIKKKEKKVITYSENNNEN